MADVDVPRTFGALLIGGLFATLLSGGVTIQAVVYLKLYPTDKKQLKGLMLVVWLLDHLHTVFIWLTLWAYLITAFGKASQIDKIDRSLSITIVLTAILTFLVHCFLAQRIFKLSRDSYLMTVPIVVLAVLRLASAAVTTGKMIQLGSFELFRLEIRWVFTLGLALSTAVDIFITGCLFMLLHASRMNITPDSDINTVIDNLIKYTFETGAMTCVGTIVAMILWVTMPTNLIFMGLHFVIGKFYANSFLVTLNTRQALRHRNSSMTKDRSGPGNLHLPIVDNARRRDSHSESYASDLRHSKIGMEHALQVTVERSVVFIAD